MQAYASGNMNVKAYRPVRSIMIAKLPKRLLEIKEVRTEKK